MRQMVNCMSISDKRDKKKKKLDNVLREMEG